MRKRVMEIYFDEEDQVSAELLDTMRRAAEISVRNEGLDPDIAEVSVSFVSADRIRELNRDYRDVDRVTDVLSFPQSDSVEELEENAAMTGVMELGDVVICVDRAEQQAAEYGHSFERELIYLFVHSMHHLMGYDHMVPEEKRVMRAREEAVMTELGIPRREDGPEDVPAPEMPTTKPDAAGLPYQRALYRRAQNAMENAYAPYSGYRVGAALLAEDGSVWTGVNVENASYGAAICAERTACVKAVSEGRTSFRAIAVAASEGQASMCGICRQFLAEFSPEMEVITGEDDEHLESTKLSVLLPAQFRLREEKEAALEQESGKEEE